MNFTYLLLALRIILVPILILCVKKTNFSHTIKFAIPAVLITAAIFSIPTTLLVLSGAWSFNEEYITGIYLWKMPIEEIIFYIAILLAGIGIYAALNESFPNNALDKFSLSVSNVILGVCVAMLFFTYTKWYSATTFGILFVLLIFIEYIGKIRFMYRFYRAFLVFLVLFYICQLMVAQLPIITYSDTFNLKIGNIPFESQFYFMGMLLMSIYLFEWFKGKAKD